MLAVAGLGGAAPPPADPFLDHHAALAAKNPSAVSLELSPTGRLLPGPADCAHARLLARDLCGRPRGLRSQLTTAVDQFRVDRDRNRRSVVGLVQRRPRLRGGGLHGFDDLDADRPSRRSQRVVPVRSAGPLPPTSSPAGSRIGRPGIARALTSSVVVGLPPIRRGRRTLERANRDARPDGGHVASRPMSYGGALRSPDSPGRRGRAVSRHARGASISARRSGNRYLSRSAAVSIDRELVAGLVGSPHRELVIAGCAAAWRAKPGFSPRFMDAGGLTRQVPSSDSSSGPDLQFSQQAQSAATLTAGSGGSAPQQSRWTHAGVR